MYGTHMAWMPKISKFGDWKKRTQFSSNSWQKLRNRSNTWKIASLVWRRTPTILPSHLRVTLLNRNERSRKRFVRNADEALKHFPIQETAPYLLECLKDTDSRARDHAKTTLDRMREYEEQKRVWESLLGDKEGSKKTKSTADALIELLKSKDPESRLLAIKALAS